MSVDYQSHDAEVIETISLLCLHLMTMLTGYSEQVTLEIQTNPAKTPEKSNAGTESKEEKKSEYQLPPELLE